jgi:hypothetical protein
MEKEITFEIAKKPPIEKVRLSRDFNSEHLREGVGIIKGDTYITNRLSVLHFYKKGQGFPISLALLKDLKLKGIRRIRIVVHNKDFTSQIFQASIHDYDQLIPFRERGQDTQCCLPLRLMHKLSD